ncbi:type I-Fv CRISPR-associated protein Cas5fv [Avibacterium sp. 21-595]|uniref:type I-Fv CRISPR-associated protein Cas5fv n=1 Tax=unclassified Avibacterium TaxID=2685287 RepID=UPI002026E147|nr:type I-Fv CRISPR-associated protein Cas5fv [Avibacterium sp. 21-595]URL01942.1 type I-Fv CRISPR-associated protein Cas5fv [Avibacterium sp. 20-126]URL06735.1 type I-Fv CRISPR-associated protein Cas5fv [Avibacterium sp. 21-595]
MLEIMIDYEASWRNSFLNGSNDESLPKKGRDFIASMTELKKAENYHQREITQNTVLGVLCRLIGDQRKLYQAKQSGCYYFRSLEDKISFEDNIQTVNQEVVYIRNIKGSTDQNAFTGMIKSNDPIFQSDYSQAFWGVLALSVEELCEFILNDTQVKAEIPLNPVHIIGRLDLLKKEKPIPFEGKPQQAAEILKKKFLEEYKSVNTAGKLLILPLYCSALYLQLERLEKKYDMATAKSARGGISGISKNGHTTKDFMEKYTTGNKKIIYGNPYIRSEFKKGEGEVKYSLTKASGQLSIKLDIDIDKAQELKSMIENAGVSPFPLGKKGLAYVSAIRFI